MRPGGGIEIIDAIPGGFDGWGMISMRARTTGRGVIVSSRIGIRLILGLIVMVVVL